MDRAEENKRCNNGRNKSNKEKEETVERAGNIKMNEKRTKYGKPWGIRSVAVIRKQFFASRALVCALSFIAKMVLPLFRDCA